MSQMFYPFAECEANHLIQFGRGDKYKCYLPLMEYYEKLFLFLWVWVSVLFCLTLAYTVYTLTFLIPLVKLMIYGKSVTAVGNVFILTKIKSVVGHLSYVKLLKEIHNGKSDLSPV